MMQRYAIFVDAGYLFAAGSTVLTGSDLPRYDIELDQDSVIKQLQLTAHDKVGDASLLRIYWYDGLLSGGFTNQQRRIADTDDVKLRLGIVNAFGQQKGVDSLIVIDLVELARNHAISDAVVLSGDEDVRIGVQIAQSFGVRVHLIGIEPPRNNQSRSLAQESDTTTEWKESDIRNFMSIAPDATAEPMGESATSPISDNVRTLLDQLAERYVQSLSLNELTEISRLNENAFIPRILDAPLMARGRESIGYNLNRDEQIYLRNRFISAARNATD